MPICHYGGAKCKAGSAEEVHKHEVEFHGKSRGHGKGRAIDLSKKGQYSRKKYAKNFLEC